MVQQKKTGKKTATEKIIVNLFCLIKKLVFLETNQSTVSQTRESFEVLVVCITISLFMIIKAETGYLYEYIIYNDSKLAFCECSKLNTFTEAREYLESVSPCNAVPNQTEKQVFKNSRSSQIM